MTVKVNKALARTAREKQIDVDCGGGFIVTVRNMSMHNQEFRAKLSEYVLELQKKRQREEDDGRRRVKVGADPINIGVFTDMSKEDTVDFFCRFVLIGWAGLTDDDGRQVEFNIPNARSVFGDTDEGMTLMDRLTFEAQKEANFAPIAERDAAEAIGKKS